MAKQNLKAGKKSVKTDKAEPKSGKGKRVLLLILLLLLLIVGVVYFFGIENSLTSFFDEGEEMTSAEGELSLEDQLKMAKALPEVIQVEKVSQVPEPPAPVKKPQKKFYVKVDDCINITCEEQIVNFLKQEKLPYTKRKLRKKTKYYELISSTVFSRKSALEKMDELSQLEDISNYPVLVKENRRYRISMGAFLDEETGVRIKSDLAKLYHKVNIDFDLRVTNRNYTVNSIYAGPFKKDAAEAVQKRLKQYPEYESSTVSRMP